MTLLPPLLLWLAEEELEEETALDEEEELEEEELKDEEVLLEEDDSESDDSLLEEKVELEELPEELRGALELPVGKTIRPQETRENTVNARSRLRIFFIFLIVRLARAKVDGKTSRKRAYFSKGFRFLKVISTRRWR